jgi:enoyl-CoA hydratase/carnithine racemase
MLEEIRHADVLELRLERPPANALSPELIGALERAVRSAPARGARALVLSGRAGMFSAGLDVPLFVALDRPGARAAWRAFLDLMRALVETPVPLACALTGHAPAGGCVLALCSHWRVMAQGAFRIGMNEVAVGVRVPEPIWAVARHAVGDRAAERMCTGSELFDAEGALRIGLVDELVAPEDVVPRARKCRGHRAPRHTAQHGAPRGALESARRDSARSEFDEWFGRRAARRQKGEARGEEEVGTRGKMLAPAAPPARGAWSDAWLQSAPATRSGGSHPGCRPRGRRMTAQGDACPAKPVDAREDARRLGPERCEQIGHRAGHRREEDRAKIRELIFCA